MFQNGYLVWNMKTSDKNLQLQKILLEEIISGKIDLLIEQVSTNPEDAKKTGEATVETQEIAPQINDLVSKIKTADANLKKSENDFVNVVNNVLNRAKSSDGLTDPQIVANNIENIEKQVIAKLTQNKTVSYKNLATRDNTMLAIINLLNTEYERLTGKKLPTFNVNKILPGLMAARAAGISVPSTPSQPTTPARSSTGTTATTSTKGTSGTIRAEHKEAIKQIIKEIVSLMRKEPEPKPSSKQFDFESFKKKIKSRDWNNKWEAINSAKDNLTELGQGTSRIAFLLPDRRVLKVAKNEAGIDQNKQELKIFLNPSIAQIYTKIYEWDKGRNWILTEYVKPFNSRNDFLRETGIRYSVFETLLSDVRKWLARDLQDLRELYEEMLELSKSEPLKYDEEEIKNKIEGIDKIIDNEKAYNFFTRLINLMQRGLIEKDFVYKHFGKSSDGQIKLYDYGYSIDVFKKHYK